MRKRFGVGAAVVALAAVAIALAVGIGSGSAAKSSPYKVAWIYPGPHNDHGWSQAHDVGRLYVQKTLGVLERAQQSEDVMLGCVRPLPDSLIRLQARDGCKCFATEAFREPFPAFGGIGGLESCACRARLSLETSRIATLRARAFRAGALPVRDLM